MRVWMPVRLTPVHGVGGGMERVAWTMAKGLAARGHEVIVVTTAHPNGVTEASDDGVEVRFVPGSTWRRYQHGWWDASYGLLRAEHDRAGIDVILSQSAGGLGYITSARKELAVPSAVVLHGSARAEVRTGWRGARTPRGAYRLARLGWRLPRLMLRWRAAASAVGHWLAVSPAVAAANTREIGIPAASITTVPVGVDTDRFRPDGDARAAGRDRLGVPESAFVLALVTRLEREKGVDVALAAVQRLRAHHPDLWLVVAGCGHDGERLRREARRLGILERCSFLGLVDHDELPGVLAVGEVFVFPSLSDEGTPASIVEASACGLPVVASQSLGTAGLVIDGVTGVLVPRGDVSALCAALSSLATDDDRRRQMGARGREAAVTRWDANAMVRVVERVLVDVVAQPKFRGRMSPG